MTAHRRSNSEALTATLELQGQKIIDIGCGEGHLVRLMTRHGAKVIGVECSSEMLEKAHAEKPVGDEVFHDGRAEDLPFSDGSIDIVVFFNSLHHVPMDSMDQALSEAARVLKSSGKLYVCEPVADGPHFELMQPVHDETVVRAKAYETLQKSETFALSQDDEFTYIHPAFHKDYDSFVERMLRINPEHEQAVQDFDAQLRSNFERLGEPTDKGSTFDQPMRVNLFTKA
ncbi:class I SAM-dependent methyltransferase [Magnetovibrio sp. PR-2]|uniref:class I SAM-dependent methyltransferase n=1 Tax=Magnetovibrio sp. PR-2 TaxID=3120356 RepID=UPI002FCDEAF4